MILRVCEGACLVFRRNPLHLRFEIEANFHGMDSKLLWTSMSLRHVHRENGMALMRELQVKYREDPRIMQADMIACDIKAIA